MGGKNKKAVVYTEKNTKSIPIILGFWKTAYLPLS